MTASSCKGPHAKGLLCMIQGCSNVESLQESLQSNIRQKLHSVSTILQVTVVAYRRVSKLKRFNFGKLVISYDMPAVLFVNTQLSYCTICYPFHQTSQLYCFNVNTQLSYCTLFPQTADRPV